MSFRLFSALRLLLVAAVAIVTVWTVVDLVTAPTSTRFLGRLHPLVVHLPIGILLLTALLELASRRPAWAGVREAVPTGLALGTLTAVVSAAAGWLLAEEGGYESAMLDWHRILGIGVAVTAALAWAADHARRRGSALGARSYPALLTLSVACLFGAGHLGGSLTHGADYLTSYLPAPFRLLAGPSAADASVIGDPEKAEVYETLIAPILSARCVACHGPDRQAGDLRLDSPEGIHAGGEDGPVLFAGQAFESELIRRLLLPPTDDDRMPPGNRPGVTPGELALLRWWIDGGASFDTTIADLEVSPDVATALTGLLPPPGERRTGVFALEIPAPDTQAIARLVATGLSIRPVAADLSLLQLETTNVARRFDDEMLGSLRPLAQQLTWIDLSGTAVTDAGLEVLAGMPHLTRLSLRETAVTDAGLRHLAGLQYLSHLNLYGTSVTDAGLDHLAQLPGLRALYLWQTQVTDEGVNRLTTRLPRLEVERGLTLVELPSATPAE